MKKNLILIIVISLLSILNAQNTKRPLSITGTDPTEVRDRIDVIIGEAQFTTSRNLFAFSGEGYIAVLPWLSVGAKVPIVYSYSDLEEDRFSLGDINVGLLTSFFSHQGSSMFTRVAFGFKYSFDTGDPAIRTGVGQQVLIPRLTAIFSTPEGDAFVAPEVEYRYSVNNDPDYLSINKLAIRVKGTLTFNDFWITLAPSIRMDFTDVYETTYYLGSTLGKMLSKKAGLSFDFVYSFAGEPDFDYLGRLSYRYLF